MDAFWLIPLAIVVIPLLWAFWSIVKKQPVNTVTPHILLDKPAEPVNPDPAEAGYDWEVRPCASFLDWYYAPSKESELHHEDQPTATAVGHPTR